MKKSIKFFALIVAAVMLFSLTACGKGSGKAVKFTDMMGHEVKLDKPAERIVALSAADCEIVYALGAGDLLVGRGEYCDYPAVVYNVPSVESGGNTNIEQILALKEQALELTRPRTDTNTAPEDAAASPS